MSSWLALFCLPPVKKHFVQRIVKQLLDSVFVIFRIIKVSVRVISLSRRLRLITPTLTLIILDIAKTSSKIIIINNKFPWMQILCMQKYCSISIQ